MDEDKVSRWKYNKMKRFSYYKYISKENVTRKDIFEEFKYKV
ncbi:MAG: hypothetical protein ACRC4M_01595 [Mycoplasma sp.]